MIGQVIKSLLDANTNLNTLVPILSRFPYVINENTTLPAIIYTIDSVLPEYDKEHWHGDNCRFSIISFSEDYTTLQNISLQVRTALELKSGTISDITIEKIYLIDQIEGYSITESVFLNKLVFSVKVIEY